MGSPKHTMKLLFSLLVCTILSQTLCSVTPVSNIVKREALPEAARYAPHRGHYYHGQPSYSYNSHYNTGYNAGYNAGYNNRRGSNLKKLLPLKGQTPISHLPPSP